MEKTDKCTTCNINLINKEGSVNFPCPNCMKSIGRCQSCRILGNNYECHKCGFVGP